MKRLKKALAALAVVSLVGAASCGEAGPVAPETSLVPEGMSDRVAAPADLPVLPFKAATWGMMVGMEPAPSERCPAERPMLVTYLGRGNATHMGRITVSGSECLFGDPTDPTTLESGEGEFILTAANGDHLSVGYDRTVLRLEGPASPWVLWSAEIYATGGTGRFDTAELVETLWIGGLNLLTYETWSRIDGGVRLR